MKITMLALPVLATLILLPACSRQPSLPRATVTAPAAPYSQAPSATPESKSLESRSKSGAVGHPAIAEPEDREVAALPPPRAQPAPVMTPPRPTFTPDASMQPGGDKALPFRSAKMAPPAAGR